MPLSAKWSRLPKIVAELPSNVEEANARFDERVTVRFPLGTPEAELISEIVGQGFKLLDPFEDELGGINHAVLYRRRFPIVRKWLLCWRSSEGRITQISGVFGIQAP